MARQLILDASIMIACEQDPRVLSRLAHDDVALPALAWAEYAVGIEFAMSDAQRANRRRALDAMEAVVPVLDYTVETAAAHAQLLAAVRRSGRPRGPHDLIIAAHAVETGRHVATLHRRARFADLPGVVVADLSS